MIKDGRKVGAIFSHPPGYPSNAGSGDLSRLKILYFAYDVVHGSGQYFPILASVTGFFF